MSAIRILIIEDEPPIARYLQQILVSKNYRVSGIAFSAADAYDKLAQKGIDLVLLDINLNGQFSGLDIAESLNSRFQLPFIFITSYADEDTLAKAKTFGPLGYIVKPFTENEIFAAIEVGWHNYSSRRSTSVSLEYINRQLSNALTTREFDIMLDVTKGLPYKEISTKHHISVNTVSSHIKNLFAKLEVHSRGELTEYIRQL